MSANEGRTYTHEGTKNFRLHNVVSADPEIVRQAISSKWAKNSSGPAGDEHHNLIVAAFKPSHFTQGKDGEPAEVTPPLSADADRGDQDPLVFEARVARNGRGAPEELVPPLKAESGQTGKGDGAPLVFRKAQKAHDPDDCERWEEDELNDTLHRAEISTAIVSSSVRRLTPLECERLQAFPDGWSCTCTPIDAYASDPDGAALRCSCPDSPRYRALGNAVTTSVVFWLAQRLAQLPNHPRTLGR